VGQVSIHKIQKLKHQKVPSELSSPEAEVSSEILPPNNPHWLSLKPRRFSKFASSNQPYVFSDFEPMIMIVISWVSSTPPFDLSCPRTDMSLTSKGDTACSELRISRKRKDGVSCALTDRWAIGIFSDQECDDLPINLFL
jgi:hypothetical protein